MFLQPGIHNLSNEAYHARPEISKSGLALLRKTPAHYAAKYLYDVETEQTKAMILGSAFHKLQLEPQSFWNEFAVCPAVDKRTKAGKAEYEDFTNKAAGKTVIDQADYETILSMSSSINRHAGASILLGMPGIAEESFFWQDERTGVHCKCRPDWRIPSRRILVDLKSCEDASPEAFSRTIYNFTYHMQASFYLDGVRSVLMEQYSTFIFIAVEKKHPFAVAVYQLDADDIDKGRMEQENLLRLFKWCQENDTWPGYPEEIQTIKMPNWANAKEVAIYE